MPTVSSVLPSVQQRGRLVYVDSRFGNNATGRVERADLPFRTIEAAFNAALAAATGLADPFTVHVRPGRYIGTSGLMTKPVDRSINFEFEAGVYLDINIAPGQSWLVVQGLNSGSYPVYLNFGDASAVRVFNNGEAAILLDGLTTTIAGYVVFKCATLQNFCLGPTSAFAKVPAGRRGSLFADVLYLLNSTSAEGQAFFRTDTGFALISYCELYVRSISEGRRIFLDTAQPQSHYFYSRFHRGTIAGDTATDSPIWCDIADGTFITNEFTTSFPLGIKPQTYSTQGKFSVQTEGLFIPDVFRDQGLGFLQRRVGEFEFGGNWPNGFQPWTNKWTQNGGEVSARFNSTFSPLPPAGSAVAGWFIQGQRIKGFRIFADNAISPGTTLRLGTANLGPLSVPFASGSVTTNGIEVPLAGAPGHHLITTPNDQIAIFNVAGPALTYGSLQVTAELAKPI